MKIERIILIFKKGAEKLLKEIIVNNLEISIIKKLFKSKDGDPHFYSPYLIEQIQYNNLIKYVPELNEYPSEKFELYLEAFSV